MLSALVGYNAGPGNADRWRERPGSDDPLYVETLEYREPRIYVQAILSNLYLRPSLRQRVRTDDKGLMCIQGQRRCVSRTHLYHYVRLYGKE
ncbi:MAG: hypothetical protein R2851_25625 [Caldilineaceae bacterium]